jgi:hypothetical protein
MAVTTVVVKTDGEVDDQVVKREEWDTWRLK